MRPFIILIGYSDDENLRHLKTVLSEMGYNVFRLNLGANTSEYLINWNVGHPPVIWYQEQKFDLDLFQNAALVFVKWWRMDSPSLVSYQHQNLNYENFAKREWNAFLQSALLYFQRFNTKIWFGDLVNISNSSYKVFYLSIANKLGIKIPDLFISNTHKYFSKDNIWVSKAINKDQRISETEEFFTVEVSNEFLYCHITDKTLETPSLIQQKILKRYEIRAFFLAKEVFAVKLINRGSDSHVDSRLHQDVLFENYVLNDDLEEQIINLGKELDIDYFALDILFDEKGYAWLVDITPEGSWFYYENEQMLITKKIAKILKQEIENRKQSENIVAKWKGRPIDLIKSERGSLHCFQACVVMALKALKGIEITLTEAEELTNFVKGRDTWPHMGFLTFAKQGINVTSVENMNPKSFIEDPVKEIHRIYDDPDIAAYIIKITDLEKERELLRKCLANPLINFDARDPNYTDIYRTLSAGGLVIATIDYGVLHNTGKYEGHMVLITEIGEEDVCIFDPGPPGDANWKVNRKVFGEALFQDGSSGQLILLLPNKDEK